MDKMINSDFMMYKTDEGEPKVKVLLGNETVWLTQKQMSELFGVDRTVITKHIRNIFESRELQENTVSAKFALTASDGKNYSTKFYNLDAIISVGYRVNSNQATQFRIWATKTLREFMIKGFVMDDERLKQGGQHFGKDYFEELLERIREIRASEKIFYRKITDIFAMSADYNSDSEVAKNFFATVQNKLHWAIHKHTAAELIAERVDSKKENLGLTTWKKKKDNGNIVKSDIIVAKNYLKESEINSLNKLVNMFLDFAENMAERGKIMKMREWKEKLDSFLGFNEYEILNGLGNISHKIAKKLADKEYEKYKTIRDITKTSEFDKIVERTIVKKLNQEREREESSDFNQKLKQGLDYNPKE